MSLNGRIRGVYNSTSSGSASGIWSVNEVMLANKQSAWPQEFQTDSNFSNVVLLLKMDGSNGGTNFGDSSSYAHTIFKNGSVQTSTTIKKFGTASGRFAAGTDYLNFYNTNLNFGTGDFTVEFWLYYDSSQQAASYGTFLDNGGQGVFLSFGTAKTHLIFYSPNAGISDTTGFPHGMVTGNWYHIAYVRNGNTCKAYVDGTAIGTWTANGGSMSPASGVSAYIGNYSGGGSYTPGGYIDDYRITKGIARYTSNFTPPSSALPDRGPITLTTTDLVLNLDAGNPSSYPGSGSTWTDLTGSGRNATLVSSPTFSGSGNLTGYFSFNGSSQYASFDAGTPGTTMTIEMWVYFYETQPNGYGMYFSWNQYDVFDYQASGGIGYNTFNGDVYGISHATATSSVRNAWKHMIFEMRSDVSYTNNKIYVNKVAQSLSQLNGTENASNRLFNGGVGQIAAAGGSYTGKMNLGSFRVYKRALTQTEINNNYDYQKLRYGLS